MAKVWRQVQESHCSEYLSKKDLYTTLLHTVIQPGGIGSTTRQKFRPPPQRRALPAPPLLRHAFLLDEASHIEDYRTQILSTFGTILKFDSTKKVAS